MLAAPPLILWKVLMSQRSGTLGRAECPCGWDSAGESRGRFLKTVGFSAGKTQRDTWEEKQGCPHENILPGDYKASHPTSALLKVKVKEIGVLWEWSLLGGCPQVLVGQVTLGTAHDPLAGLEVLGG